MPQMNYPAIEGSTIYVSFQTQKLSAFKVRRCAHISFIKDLTTAHAVILLVNILMELIEVVILIDGILCILHLLVRNIERCFSSTNNSNRAYFHRVT